MSDLESIRLEMNKLGCELVVMNIETQAEQIKKMQLKINRLFLSSNITIKMTDSKGNDWYDFPLLGIVAPLDTALIALEQLMRQNKKNGEWLYQPSGGDFVLALIKRTKTLIQHNVGILKGTVSVPVNHDGSKMMEIDPPAPQNAVDDLVDRISNLQDIKYIADLIIRQAWVVKGKTNKHHFEGFFTHDRVEEIRDDRENISKEYNEAVFPAMCQKLLTYLFFGVFRHLHDVVKASVRDQINLNQGNENVGNCYGLKSPKYSSVQYNNWLKAIASSYK